MEKNEIKIYEIEWFEDLYTNVLFFNSEQLLEEIEDLTNEISKPFDKTYINRCKKAIKLCKKEYKNRSIKIKDFDKYLDKYFLITYYTDEHDIYDSDTGDNSGTYIYVKGFRGKMIANEIKNYLLCYKINISENSFNRDKVIIDINTNVMFELFGMQEITKEHFINIKNYAINILTEDKL